MALRADKRTVEEVLNNSLAKRKKLMQEKERQEHEHEDDD
jgi:hypothetical protein